ncbi:TIGR01777 family oxidoreductase [Polaribacter sp.]|nr:TIGR01777 family oxidoreductase [Polaribacter sp.]
MSKILITGGTGLVGKRLTTLLLEKQHDVVILSRNPKKKNEYKWDISKNYIDEDAFINVDYIIHLAGAGVANKRWTDKRKQLIIDSRVQTANLLFKKIKENQIDLKGFISASGSNYYGAKTSEKIYTEDDNSGNDFLGKVCVAWENAALQFEQLGIPVTILRTGVVLSQKGGALQKMITPVISPLGSGEQYMPWIHIDDLCEMYAHCVTQNCADIYNAVAPDFNTNKEFSKKLAKAVKRPFLPIKVPAFILKIILGELAVILLEGSRLSSKKIEKKGYVFQFNSLEKALANLF